MDAHSLRVLTGSTTCEALCPYCAYRKGKESPGDHTFDFRIFKLARRFALQSGAITMEIEAKGDPLADDWTKLYQILSEAAPEFPQINLTAPGKGILDAQDAFLNLVGWHLTNLTLTIPHHDLEKRKALLGLDIDYQTLVSYLKKECQLVVRASCFLSKPGISSPAQALEFIHWCREIGIQQISFREINTFGEELEDAEDRWCAENAIELDFNENWNFDDPANRIFYVNSLVTQSQAHPIFVFPWGEAVYDIEGVNVIFEKSEGRYYGQSLKSLVLSGNHVYARWESEGTIIF